MKIWCRTNQLVLQGFTLRVVLNTGARVKCLNGNEGMKVEVNMQHMGKKKMERTRAGNFILSGKGRPEEENYFAEGI